MNPVDLQKVLDRIQLGRLMDLVEAHRPTDILVSPAGDNERIIVQQIYEEAYYHGRRDAMNEFGPKDTAQEIVNEESRGRGESVQLPSTGQRRNVTSRPLSPAVSKARSRNRKHGKGVRRKNSRS